MKSSISAKNLLIIACLATGGAALLFYVVGGLPGAPQSPGENDEVRTKQDLNLEFADLSHGSYEIFDRAVQLQRQGKYVAAIEQYKLLMHAQTITGGSRNLWNESRTVAHNLAMLESRRR